MLVGSYGLLVVFAWMNRRLPALVARDGRADPEHPRHRCERRDAGECERPRNGWRPAEGLIGEGTAKHHLMGPGDTLTPLGDVIGIPPPIGAVISIGDVLLYAGIAILVVAVMLGRYGEDIPGLPAPLFQGYRGKHLPPDRRFSRLRLSRVGSGPPSSRRAPAGGLVEE